MSSRAFPGILCVICRKPVDLQTDLYADESGKAVHADCYTQRIISAGLAQAWANSLFSSNELVGCTNASFKGDDAGIAEASRGERC